MFIAYVLRNKNGVLYKGSTDNLEKRLIQHNEKGTFKSFTRNRGFWVCVYSKSFATRKEAEAREKFFKSGQGREFLKEIINNMSA